MFLHTAAQRKSVEMAANANFPLMHMQPNTGHVLGNEISVANAAN